MITALAQLSVHTVQNDNSFLNDEKIATNMEFTRKRVNAIVPISHTKLVSSPRANIKSVGPKISDTFFEAINTAMAAK